jgi:maleylacetate reductase
MTGADQQSVAPLTIAGSGTLNELANIVDRAGSRAALLVVGPGCGPVAERVATTLGHRWVGNFSDAVAHVPAQQANLAVASAQEVHADSVISLGGGSAAGYAKIVALALRLPWIAVPTTLSGAEMTSRYLVTTDKGKKAGRSRRTAAAAVVHDPDLLAQVPPAVLASSGMVAVASCLESLATGAPVAAELATEGLRLLWPTLPRLLAEPGNAGFRARAQRGAALAGAALEAAGPGPAQLIAEDLGARHRCDHGALLACLLPKVAQPVAALREVAGDGSAPELVASYARALGLPTDLRQLCPYPDTEAMVERLVSRPDVAGHADATVLRPILEGAV